MLTRANSISRLLYSRSNTETSSVTVWELKGRLTLKLELRMNENCMCADTCSPVIQPDQSCSLCSISVRLYVTVSLIWAVQNHPSQQWRTCCFTDDSHKTSRGDFHLLSAISFMFHGWAMEGSNPAFLFPPTALRNVSVREKDESRSHRFLWLLRLFRSTRLRLNPEPESEIWPIKSCFLQAADLMNKLFTVTAGKLRRCPVREAQREFNPNRFSSWFLAQVRLINY